MADDAIPVSTRLRRSTPYHDAYTVRVYDERFASLATARPADARRWVATTRWLHGGLLYRGRLIVGLGVQWTPTRAALRGETPVPATLQLCVGHRCLVFHLARADAVPEALRRLLADPRVTFVGSGAKHDARMLWSHYGLDVARGVELRAAAGMGNASVEQMADRFLGYSGICKPREVAMSAWHAPRLSLDQVQYASLDAYLAFRLGVVLLCPAGAAKPPPPPARAPVQRVPAIVDPAPRAHVVVHAARPVQRAPAVDVPTVFIDAPRPVRRAPAVDVPTVFIDAPRPVQRAPAVAHVPTVFVHALRPDAGITTYSKVGGTHGGVTDDSDTDSYDDVLCRAPTRGLPVRAYASDSDYSLDSSDGFEGVLGAFAFTDEDDDDDDEDEEEEEEDCNNEDAEQGYNNEADQEGNNYNSGAGMGMDGSAELVSGEVVIDGCVEGNALAQDDWYDQVLEFGFDEQNDEEEEFEEFYLL